MSAARSRRRGVAAPWWLGAAAVVVVLTGCTTDGPSAPPTSPAPAASSPGVSASGAPSATDPTGSASLASPTSPEVSTPPTPSGSPTYFTPTDASGYAMSGRIAVEQARQDPFSNLLLRGALHGHAVTLDVVGTPDLPVSAGPGATILFGTCKCDARGSGLRVTVADASAVQVEPNGDVTIHGTFRPVVTASDAITLTPA